MALGSAAEPRDKGIQRGSTKCLRLEKEIFGFDQRSFSKLLFEAHLL